MNFREAMAADKAVFMNESEFAVPVTYRKKGSPDVIISGVFSLQDGFDSRPGTASQTGLLVIWVNDIAKPEYGDAVIIDGKEWKVMPNIRGGDISWVLELSNDMRHRF